MTGRSDNFRICRRRFKKTSPGATKHSQLRAPLAGAAVAIGLALLLPPALKVQAHDQTHGTQLPDELVRQVVNHELEAEKDDQSRWMYIDQDHIKNQTKAVIETPHGTVYRLLAIHGEPLNAQQEETENQRIQRLLKSPSQQQKLKQNEQNDTKQTEQLFKMLPDAWKYTLASRSGDITWLNFTPNPSFNPPSYQARALHEMSGKLELNTAQMRLMSISGRLMQSVSFGWFGILGHLAKGGTFDVRQSQVGQGFWRISLLRVNMNGKALWFKTISVHQYDVRSHFERMPDDLTLEEAESRLREVHYPL